MSLILEKAQIHKTIQEALIKKSWRNTMEIDQILEDAAKYHEANEFDIAKIMYERILSLNSNHYEAAHMLGVIAFQRGDHRTAVLHFDQAIKLKPDYAEAYSNFGNVLHAAGNYAVAAKLQEQALQINPKFANAYNNLGNSLLEQGDSEKARDNYLKAIELRFHHPEAHNNLGNAYTNLKDFKKAEESYVESLNQDPNSARTWLNYGHLLVDSLRFEEAQEKYERCNQLDPGYPQCHFNLALLYLLNGDFEKGWKEYEWRTEWMIARGIKEADRNFAQPKWQGESLENKTLFLTAEQGYGDIIMFSRYASLIIGQAKTVILEVKKGLGSFLGVCTPGVILIEEGDQLPEFDYWIPLMSLPKVFNTNLTNIPNQKLKNREEKLNEWRNKLGVSKNKRIGLCWKGSENHRFNPLRAISLSQLLKTLPNNFDYISLQKDVTEEEKELLSCYDITDFSDVGALCELVDLIITVDTAVAHVAGGLGVPVWTLIPYLPDWRWLKEGDKTLWYPSMKLYRQEKPKENPGTLIAADWAPVFDRIKEDLKTL